LASSALEARTVVVDVPETAALHPVAVSAVHLNDPILARMRRVLRTKSLPLQYERLETTGVLSNFVRAAGGNDAPFHGKRYADSDLYKWIEAATWICAEDPDPQLVELIDRSLGLIEQAQHPDGYLNTHFSAAEAGARWTNVAGMNEFYVAGHLFSAAVAHARVFGSSRFLRIARRMADHMVTTFGPQPDQLHAIDSHPGVETALVELARETGEDRYVELADFLLSLRGHGLLGGRAYNQDETPFRERGTFEGHAVCAGYLCCGAADLYLQTGDKELMQAQLRMWDSLTRRRLYVSGGFGSRWIDESVGADFELPNTRAYAETCAAVSSVMWNWRLLLTLGESRFADLIEHTLYNAVLPGVALDGLTFFYQNPLQDDGSHRRSDWFDICCCPPNLSRLIGSIPGYVYTVGRSSVAVQLYVAGSAELTTADGRALRIRQETDYPRQGHVAIRIESDSDIALQLRVPRWAHGTYTLRVNGRPVERPNVVDGYAVVTRTWTSDDLVELDLPMTVRAVRAHPHALENTGRIAFLRGPVLYCAEAVDNDALDLLDLAADPTTAQEECDADVLAGAVRIGLSGRFHRVASGWETSLYGPSDRPNRDAGRPTAVRLVPYYAWANRAAGPMAVWLRPLTPNGRESDGPAPGRT
jgi:DUF1680 family protein